MKVQAPQRKALPGHRRTHHARQELAVQGQAELAALVPRRDVGVRMGNDSRGDAKQDLRPPPLVGREVREHLKLHEPVDDNTVRGDYDVNEVKLKNLLDAAEVNLASNR